MNIKKWIKQNTHDLSGKVVAITGSTGGLGNEVCKILTKLGATLVLLNRNEEKTQKQIENLKKINSNLNVKFLKINMEDIDSVKNTCQALQTEKIDVLILNAGAFNLERRKTSLGFDNIFQINFVSPYFVAKQMLENKNPPQKIVVVGSIAHRYATLNKNDLDLQNETDSQKIYGNAKRLLMFSLFELFKNQTKTTLSICHPGITLTNLTSNYSKWKQPMIKLSMKLLYMPPKKACLSIVKGVFDETPAYTWIGPKKKDIWGEPTKNTLDSCTEVESKEIFEVAEKIYADICKK